MKNTALLIMDMQQGILSNYPEAHDLIEIHQKALKYARQNGIQVIYVHLCLRDGLVEISPSNKMFHSMKDAFLKVPMDYFALIDERIHPEADDIIVAKKRVSAFTGSDLEIVLRAKGINHMVLSGVATSGVVLSTLREAADKDYEITVLSDACKDRDDEVHRVLTEKIFPRQATVVTTEEWMK